MATTTKSALSFPVLDALAGGALGAGLGAGLGALTAGKGHRRTGAAYGGLAGLALGGLHGTVMGLDQAELDAAVAAARERVREKARASATSNAAKYIEHKPMVAHAPWMAGITSKRDAHAQFRALARTQHPDMGGSHKAMQDLNAQWATVQQHPDFQKLAFCYDHGRRAALARFGA